MQRPNSLPKLTQPFLSVKFDTPVIDDTPSNPMRHHKGSSLYIVGNTLESIKKKSKRYGVSSEYRILTKGMLNKHFDKIVHCLRDVVGLPTCEREAALALLRFWAYYGEVYPKASQCCSKPGCSKATFWRAVMYLKDLGLIRTIPRFLIREHAQISNLYRLDKLLIVIARYLAEHGVQFLERWLKPYLSMAGSLFWGSFVTSFADSSPPST